MKTSLLVGLTLAIATAGCFDRPAQRTEIEPHKGKQRGTDSASTSSSENNPRPRPGLDLSGPIAIAPNSTQPRDPAEAARREVEALALGADRGFVPVDIPTPPRGGAVGFQFGDDKRGWVARVPESRQLPAAAYGDGTLYVSGGFESVNFYALDAETGRFTWAATDLDDNGPTAAIYQDGQVVFNTESCTLFVLDAKTGRKRWSLWLGDPTLAQTAVADGLVYAAHPSPEGPRLSAYKLHNGARVWSRRVAAELLAAPIVHGDSVYVTTIGGIGYRFERRRGVRRWRSKLDATTAPWINGDELFVTRRDGDDEALAVVDTATGEPLRTHHRGPGGHLRDVPRSLQNWRKVWEFEGSRPVIAGGVSYTAMGAQVVAADTADGRVRWVREHPRSGDASRDDDSQDDDSRDDDSQDDASRTDNAARALGSVAIAGPQVVVASRKGRVVGLDIDTGYTLWAYDLDQPIVAEPIVARGWVYVTTKNGRVIGLQVGDSSLDGWHMFGGSPGHNGPMPSADDAARAAQAPAAATPEQPS